MVLYVFTWREDKWTSNDALAVYELRAEAEDIFGADPQWLRVIYQPWD